MIEMSGLTIECADLRRYERIVKKAKRRGFQVEEVGPMKALVRSPDASKLGAWSKRYERRASETVERTGPFKPYMKSDHVERTLNSYDTTGVNMNATRSWFKATEYASIYGFPAPDPSAKIVVGVVSFGGGLVGTVDANGILTSGDIQSYWSYVGIPSGSMPTVKIVTLAGATNSPNPNDGATAENTLDVQMIGACCPSPGLTIILYIIPNSLNNFAVLFNYMLNTPVTVGGIAVKPDIISVSWGLAEIYYSVSQLNSINALLATAASRGIPVTVATGDYGSNNGVGGSGAYADFPSSSPNVIACGGTKLVCPNYVYDGSTVETAWTSGGGAVSARFSKPTYQAALSGSFRRTPDIALNSDPATGTLFMVGGQYVVYGGTSVAAPAMAGYLASIRGKVFATPLLYAGGSSCYNDIVSGTNGAFAAVAGYDNCTGLGSIRGASLATAISGGGGAVVSVSLNATTASLRVGGTFQAVAILNPLAPTNSGVTWSSNNTGVATVNTTGLVSAVANGSATITVTTADGGFTATLGVTVTTAATSVSLSTPPRVSVGGTYQMVATVLPSGASNKTVTWTSATPTVATVSGGLVTGVRTGSSRITVRTTDGGFTAVSTVTVYVGVTGVTLNRATVTLRKGATSSLVATVVPGNAVSKNMTWSSSNTVIATMSSTGIVTARRAGSCVITVRTADGGFTATCAVTVN